MKSVLIAVAALFVFALPVQAAEKPVAPAAKQTIAADDTCAKALADCQKGGKSEADCKLDAAVQAACPKQ
jgi:hypothetical protein